MPQPVRDCAGGGWWRASAAGIAAALVLVAVWAGAAGRAAAAEVMMHVGDTQIPAGTVVDGDAVTVNGSMTVAGTVNGDAVVVGGTLRVRGRVGHDARALGGDVVVEPGATVGGTAEATGGNTRIMPGARVLGRAPSSAPPPPPGGIPPVPLPSQPGQPPGAVPIPPPYPTPPPGAPWPFGGWLPPGALAFLAMWKALALLFLALTLLSFVGMAWFTAVTFPRATAGLADLLDREPVSTLIAGLVTLALIGPVIVLLAVTVVGIGLILALPAVLLVAWQAGLTAVSVLVGRRVRPSGIGREALIGSVLIALAFAIPHVGWLVLFMASAWGLGAVALALIHRQRAQPSGPPAGAPQPGSGAPAGPPPAPTAPMPTSPGYSGPVYPRPRVPPRL